MESLDEFYQHKFGSYPLNSRGTIGQFNVFRIEDRMKNKEELPAHVRRNFFKIMLFSGSNTFRYGHQVIETSGNTLLFFHPHIPYSYQPLAPDTKGLFCVFKSDFFQEKHRLDLDQLPLFNSPVPPVIRLTKQQYKEVEHLFNRMLEETKSEYIYKYELIKNYVSELYFLAMKWMHTKPLAQSGDASNRITTIFMELLEQQFPIQYTYDKIQLRTPKDYAEQLHVHVNYLNRCIRKATGKTTSEQIYERIGTEAKVLLKYTNWTISEICDTLGFEDLAHFNKFFRNQADMNPTAFRLV